MNDSILKTMKEMLTGYPEDENFNTELIVHINSMIMTLNRIGVGKNGFLITGESETWSDFLGENENEFEGVKTYMYNKIRLIFDPPTNSFIVESLERSIKEFEWNLYINAELKRGEANNG